jgi:hypothetical protein
VEGSTGEPDFLSGVKNVTVPEGRDVTLSCSVKNLGSHKVPVLLTELPCCTSYLIEVIIILCF